MTTTTETQPTLTGAKFKIIASAMTNGGAWAKTQLTLPGDDEAAARRAFYAHPLARPDRPCWSVTLDLIKTGYLPGFEYHFQTLATRSDEVRHA